MAALNLDGIQEKLAAIQEYLAAQEKLKELEGKIDKQLLKALTKKAGSSAPVEISEDKQKEIKTTIISILKAGEQKMRTLRTALSQKLGYEVAADDIKGILATSKEVKTSGKSPQYIYSIK